MRKVCLVVLFVLLLSGCAVLDEAVVEDIAEGAAVVGETLKATGAFPLMIIGEILILGGAVFGYVCKAKKAKTSNQVAMLLSQVIEDTMKKVPANADEMKKTIIKKAKDGGIEAAVTVVHEKANKNV